MRFVTLKPGDRSLAQADSFLAGDGCHQAGQLTRDPAPIALLVLGITGKSAWLPGTCSTLTIKGIQTAKLGASLE